MRYSTNDVYGHVKDQAEADRLKMALNILNESDTIAAQEEDANHHSAAEFRSEMQRSIHVADVTDWSPSPWDPDSEFGICTICNCDVERPKQ